MATRRKKSSAAKKRTRTVKKSTSSSRKKTSRARRATKQAAKTQAPPPRAAGGERHSGYQISDADVERLLVSGEYAGLLEEYFGDSNYDELTELARQAARRTVRGGPRVLILPGIMGSKLGRERKLFFDDVIWIDPVDIARGRLEKLALRPGAPTLEALGVILFAYLKLKLRLKAAGFDADFHPFDWRQSIDRLGAELAKRVENERAGKVHLVAHSMGGLVARAALAGGLPRVDRFVMLGTPNYGSFAPVQAIRATYSAVRMVSKIDLKNSPEELSEKVFKTLPGLHQMLPSPRRFSGVDLYDASTWPTDAPVPLQRILSGCQRVQEGLADADERFHLIAGVDQETPTGLSLADGEFEYELSQNGDGTVPLDFAELENTRTWYVEEGHGSLPNNRTVGEAVIQILRSGDTNLLPTSWERRPTRARRTVRDAELRVEAFEGRSAGELGNRERRAILQGFVSADSRDEAPRRPPRIEGGVQRPPAPGYGHPLRGVRMDHTDRHAIVICFARGDITEVRARALVLGVFQEVEPAGAAAAIDARVDGAVKEFTTRRMFNGEVGEIFPLPTGRHLIYAESVLFAGLGDYSSFGPEVQEFVAENVVRTCIGTNLEEFASVLIGTGSGASVEATVYHQLAGYIRGMQDADHDRRLRRITLCERDPESFIRMKEEVVRLATTDLFGNVEVLFDQVELPPPTLVAPTRARARLESEARLAYLYVNEESRSGRTAVYRASVLTPGSKAAILTERKDVSLTELDRHLEEIGDAGFGVDELEEFGSELGKLVLDESITSALQHIGEQKQHHLVVVHDAPTARVPWETLHVDGWAPAASEGLSRRYAAESLSVAKWLERRRLEETLEVLMVVNPTGDLPGAVWEAERIKSVFPQGQSVVRLTEVREGEATRERLLEEFQSGRYDVIHYAGHAFFDPAKRSRSGILCTGGQVLSGAHLAGIANLPALLFFNACESGRVRSAKDRKKRQFDMTARMDRNVGLAEGFMRGGAANYLGTYWPVGDAAAAQFAKTFYTQLVEGKEIGAAVQAGRDTVRAIREVDWADYIHYGSYDFRLKLKDGG